MDWDDDDVLVEIYYLEIEVLVKLLMGVLYVFVVSYINCNVEMVKVYLDYVLI